MNEKQSGFFLYSSTREQSIKRSGARLRTESEIGVWCSRASRVWDSLSFEQKDRLFCSVKYEWLWIKNNEVFGFGFSIIFIILQIMLSLTNNCWFAGPRSKPLNQSGHRKSSLQSTRKSGWGPTHFLREKPWGRGWPLFLIGLRYIHRITLILVDF